MTVSGPAGSRATVTLAWGNGERMFEESWNSQGQHGSFTAVAILKSNNFPIETKVQFMLP